MRSQKKGAFIDTHLQKAIAAMNAKQIQFPLIVSGHYFASIALRRCRKLSFSWGQLTPARLVVSTVACGH